MHAIIVGLILTAGGSVEGTVAVKRDGKPAFVKNTLVYIQGYATEPPKEAPVLGQSGRAFDKVVLPVIKRSTVTFTNNEPDNSLYHHVFTPGPGTRFCSPKYKPGATYPSPKLTSEGPITMFCDIHKEMISTIYVVPNDRYVLLDTAEGDKAPFKIDGIKPGTWKIVAWHRSSKKPVEREIEIVEGKTAKVDLVIEGENAIEDALQNHTNWNKMKYDPKKPDGGARGEAVGIEDDWK